MPKFKDATIPCPHCGGSIKIKSVASLMGTRGGQKSKRKITPEQQRKMQEARANKRKQRG